MVSLARRLPLGLVLLLLLSWSAGSDGSGGPIPPVPDYADSSHWYIRDKGGVADLFYIVSTETGDYVMEGETCHYANTYRPDLCQGILKEMRAVDSLFGGRCNYYSPYYRQATMQSWGSESIAMARLPIALDDVLHSWDYYIGHYNQGRPFVLAGFSQGAHAMVEIIKHMPDSIAARMVAAYAIGYKVRQEHLDSFRHIRPAQGAVDLGVTICFNSVRSPECVIPIVSEGNVLCINPVNWRTDTVSTPFVMYGRKHNDTLTVRCDPESHLLLVGGYDDPYVMPIIGRPGNYHHRELKFYYPYLRQNIADRVNAYMERKARK